MRAQPLPDGLSRLRRGRRRSAEVAARHGLRPEQILRYDQNTPPAPGRAAGAARGELRAAATSIPDGTYRELREAAAGYCGVTPEQVVVGAGADELIAALRAHVPRPRQLGGDRRRPPTASTGSRAELEGAESITGSAERADVDLAPPFDDPSQRARERAQMTTLATP